MDHGDKGDTHMSTESGQPFYLFFAHASFYLSSFFFPCLIALSCIAYDKRNYWRVKRLWNWAGKLCISQHALFGCM